MVRCGTVWYGMVWYGTVWYCMAWCGARLPVKKKRRAGEEVAKLPVAAFSAPMLADKFLMSGHFPYFSEQVNTVRISVIFVH